VLKALFTSFDLLLIALAFGIMALGLARRWSMWREKKPKGQSGDWGGLISAVLGHGSILRRPSVGGAHLAVFWGVVLPLAVIILAQFGFTISHAPAAALSFVQDLAGVALLIGTLYLLFRRMGLKETTSPRGTLLPMVLMLVILVSGFLAEGARLSILPPDGVPATSPFGWIVSFVSPASPLFMQMMIRLHFLAVLVFIATIPFTFMRHAVATPLNILHRKKGARAALTFPALEDGVIGAKTVNDLNWKQLLDAEACVACGRCDENCPAAISGKSLSPRKIVQDIRAQVSQCGKNGDSPLLEDSINADDMWACTSCMACVEHCPASVEPLDKIIDMRRYQVMGEARLPSEARPMIRDLEIYGDAAGKGAAHKTDWAMHRDIPQLSQLSSQEVADVEVLLWVGCSGAFHPRNLQTTQAMATILKAASVKFAILGKEEMCCGDPARRLGDEILYRKLAQANIDRFNHYQVKKIVTMCPHCMNTLKNDYPELGCRIEVVHATELVSELIRGGRIHMKYPVADTITIHDACYLGRYNQVYEPLREICKAVPGTELKEAKRSKDCGYCCGGGGGRMWLHEKGGKNINVVRAEEIAALEPELIGTACPYCLVMMDDGVKSLELEKTPKVADIIDIVADSLG
jgi:Fe-S oxidoreductase/nitrate reductase gamma subunit